MKWTELLRKENYALLQSENDTHTQYVVANGYNPERREGEQWDYGTYFNCFNPKEKLKTLEHALDYFKSKTETKEKANATLVINDANEFEEDILQQVQDFTENEWKEYIKSLAQNLQDLYNDLLKTEEYGGGTAELYVLGDVINMFQAIDVEVKR